MGSATAGALARAMRLVQEVVTPAVAPNNTEKFANQCVAYLEKDSAPRLLWSGEDLVEAKLPAGTVTGQAGLGAAGEP